MEEHDINEAQKNSIDSQPESNKKIYITIVVLILLLIASGAFYNYSSHHSPTPQTIPIGDEVKEDSTAVEIFFSENYVIAPELRLAEKTLKFGDKVYLDDRLSNDTIACLYLENPNTNSAAKSYQADAYNFIPENRFGDFCKLFGAKPFSSLKTSVKAFLFNNNSEESSQYSIVQDPKRAKNSFCLGDFDGDEIQDIAVLEENTPQKTCRLLIICTDANTKMPYIAYSEEYKNLKSISSFERKTLIYMNSSVCENSPMDGIMVNDEKEKLAIVYDKSFRKYKSYYQDKASDVEPSDKSSALSD